jgi:hypothetical protein
MRLLVLHEGGKPRLQKPLLPLGIDCFTPANTQSLPRLPPPSFLLQRCKHFEIGGDKKVKGVYG